MAAPNVPVVQGVAGGTPIPVDTGAGGAGTGTITNVAANVAAVTLLAANALRLGGSIVNYETSALYVGFSNQTPTATLNSYPLPPNGVVEIPFGYTGIVRGIWAAGGSGTGVAAITEYSA